MGQHDVEYGADNSDGIISEGVNTRITNCVVKNVDGTGIKIQPLSDTNTFFGGGYGIISHSYAENCGNEGMSIYMANSGPTLNRGEITNCTARGCDTKATSASIRAHVASGCTLNDVLIAQCRVDNAGADSIQVRATGTGIITRAAIESCDSKTSAQAAIYALADGGTISSLYVRGGYLDGSSSANAQIYALASSAGTIGEAVFSDVRLRSASRGLYMRANGAGSSFGRAVVSNMDARSMTDENLYGLADSSGTFSQVSFRGNDVSGGTYGLRTIGVTTVHTDGLNTISATTPRSFATVTTLQLGKDFGVTLPATITIASGVATVSSPTHSGHLLLKIDTESAAATDDLDTLTITGVRDQQVVTLRALSSSRDVVVKDGTGNFKLNGDFTMNNTEDTITLIYHATDDFYTEISRSDNGA